MTAADGDEAPIGDGFGEQLAPTKGADLMTFSEREGDVTRLHRTGASDDGRMAASGPGIAQERDIGVSQLKLHRAPRRVIPARDVPALPF